jgi:hypothetical protein
VQPLGLMFWWQYPGRGMVSFSAPRVAACCKTSRILMCSWQCCDNASLMLLLATICSTACAAGMGHTQPFLQMAHFCMTQCCCAPAMQPCSLACSQLLQTSDPLVPLASHHSAFLTTTGQQFLLSLSLLLLVLLLQGHD